MLSRDWKAHGGRAGLDRYLKDFSARLTGEGHRNSS